MFSKEAPPSEGKLRKELFDNWNGKKQNLNHRSLIDKEQNIFRCSHESQKKTCMKAGKENWFNRIQNLPEALQRILWSLQEIKPIFNSLEKKTLQDTFFSFFR